MIYEQTFMMHLGTQIKNGLIAGALHCLWAVRLMSAYSFMRTQLCKRSS